MALAADSSGVIHVASESTVYTLTVSDGEWTARPYSSVPTGEKVADIAYAGSELVILTDSALYARSFLDASPARVSDIDGGIALATARGDVLYILTETGIHTLSAANGTPVELIPFRAHDFSGATDVAADYAGTLFVSYGETGVIAAFDNALSAVTQKTTFTLTHPLAQARPVAFALSGSRALFPLLHLFRRLRRGGRRGQRELYPRPRARYRPPRRASHSPSFPPTDTSLSSPPALTPCLP